MKRLFKAILGISCLLGWLGSCGNSGSAVLDSDLALYYKFNETGKYAIDSTGKTKSAYIDYMYNNAVYKKSIDPLKKAGVNGTSLSFDGMSNIISVEDFEQPTDSVSISLWIAPRCWESKNYAFEALVNNYNPSDKSGFLLGIHSYGEIVFEIGLEKEGTKILYGADNLANLYEWTQIGATYSSSSGRMCLYKNGQLINSITVLNHRRIKASTEVLTIGKNLFSTSINSLYENGYYAGLMDELKIYSRAISASRMKENYTSCLQNGEVPSCTYEDVYFSPDVLADDVFKPQYHTGADQMWMNEPYGLFYFKGKYHMFYQSQPHGTYLTYNSWGHVVSDDMVHWKNVFPAIVPEPNGIDNDACFSGNAIVDGNGVPYIIYTGVDNSRRALNVIAYATPEDLNDPDLIKWKKGHILFEQPEDCSYIDFRDPFLYREGDYTYMLVGTSTVKADYQSANPRCVCYKANNKDLTSWQYLGVTFEKDFATFSKTGYMWELPALYKLTSDDG
jgi:beta-fructofuranosidase